jgi:hypothetical protein
MYSVDEAIASVLIAGSHQIIYLIFSVKDPYSYALVAIPSYYLNIEEVLDSWADIVEKREWKRGSHVTRLVLGIVATPNFQRG